MNGLYQMNKDLNSAGSYEIDTERNQRPCYELEH